MLKELLKSANIYQNYSKNKSCSVFLTHSVFSISLVRRRQRIGFVTLCKLVVCIRRAFSVQFICIKMAMKIMSMTITAIRLVLAVYLKLLLLAYESQIQVFVYAFMILVCGDVTELATYINFICICEMHPDFL